jgi:hypothetical protein
MLTEFTDGDGRRILVNPAKVIFVRDETEDLFAMIRMEDGADIAVQEKLEEIKKRLGVPITPRAETIALESP